jgi:hypothetical protein
MKIFMNEKWVNRILFWALAIVPFAGVIIVGKLYGSNWFVAFLLFYTFIYRPILIIQRLLSLNKIEEKDAWKFFVPFYMDDTRYFRSLWFG